MAKSDELFAHIGFISDMSGIVSDVPQGVARKSNGTDKLRSNPEGGMLIPGEPGAVKVARPVRRGECGNVR